MKFKIGDKIRYLGTKEGRIDSGWEEYFGQYGIKKGSEGVISNYYNTKSIFVKEDGRITTMGKLWEIDLELVKSFKFRVGDKICANDNCSNDISGGEGVIEQMRGDEFTIRITKGSRHYPFGSLTCFTDWTCDIKLVSEGKFIKKEMELDVKKIDKSILTEANDEVLEEIANEQKEIAKKKLRELYDRKKVAETNAKEVGDELKEITKDLKDLTKSK